MVDQNWLKFIREQYPKGSRIRLREMKDPYHPVEPGTMGSLDFIDDMGTLHVRWDNGSGLGLIMGEDSFSILPPESQTFKLYMPMTVSYYERNKWGDLDDTELHLDDREMVREADHIIAALYKERRAKELNRGLMNYYGKNDGVRDKVQSIMFTAEVRDKKLWGVAECQVIGELTPDELAALKDHVSGQASDGVGEDFEQHPIEASNGDELYAHLWDNSDNWSVQTEQECFSPKLADGLPDMCFSVLPSTGALICIKRGESGYYPSDWSTDDKKQNVELADYNNERLGVTPEQRQAMECGSMAGWNTPGADPQNYGKHIQSMGGMSLE